MRYTRYRCVPRSNATSNSPLTRADWKTEVLAGVTTFMTMAYIVFVNPAILKEAGMPAAGVMAATCISAAVGSVLMGVLAKYPIALAPGMGINAYFAYSVVKGMGVPWQAALGGVFLSGVAFLLLTAVGVRQLIVSAIPIELHAAVAGGIGLFLALLGFENSGIVVAHPSTILALGNLHEPRTLLAIFCLLIIAAMMARRVKGAILIGMLVTTALSAALGLSHWQPQPGGGVWGTLFQLDIRAALTPRFLEVVLVLLFVTLFDNVGTLVGVARLAGMIDAQNRIPRINRILVSDAVASMAGGGGGHLFGGELHRKLGGNRGGRTNRRYGGRHRPAVRRGLLRGPRGGRDSGRRHRSGADSGGQPHDGLGCRDPLERGRRVDPGVPHAARDPVHLQHRRRPRLRIHFLYAGEGVYRRIPEGELAGVRADGAVRAAVRVLSGGKN